jgi:hypothetical protein
LCCSRTKDVIRAGCSTRIEHVTSMLKKGRLVHRIEEKGVVLGGVVLAVPLCVV